MEKRLQQIMARKAEILTEINGTITEERMAVLNTETDELLKEEAELRSKMNLTGKLGEPIAKPEARAEMGEREMRAKDLREKRAVTIASGQIAQPVETGGINGAAVVPALVDMVKVTNANGMSGYQVAYIDTDATADLSAEGEVHESDPVFKYADIVPVTITTYSEVSREVMNLTDLDYLGAVQASAMRALRRKVTEYIVNSGADGKFVGIANSETIDAETDVAINAIDAQTLRKIALNYGGEEAVEGAAVLVLSKAQLVAFGDVRGSNEKKAVYEITPDAANPNTGIIRDGGLAVRYVIASAAGNKMYYGAPAAYELALFTPFTVRVSEEAAFKRRMLAVLGEVMVGGNVTAKNGFIRVTIGA